MGVRRVKATQKGSLARNTTTYPKEIGSWNQHADSNGTISSDPDRTGIDGNSDGGIDGIDGQGINGNGVVLNDPDHEEGALQVDTDSSDTVDLDDNMEVNPGMIIPDGGVLQANNPEIEEPRVDVQDRVDVRNMSPALSNDNDDGPPPGSRNPSIAEMVESLNDRFPYAQVPVINASKSELRGLKLLNVRLKQKTNNETHNSYVEQINEMLAEGDGRVPNVQQMQLCWQTS